MTPAPPAVYQDSDREPFSAPEKPPLIVRLRSAWEGALLAGGLVYVLGYLTWALYMVQLDAGIAPPIEGQYFVSGLIPASVIALGVWSYTTAHRAFRRPPPRSRTRALLSAFSALISMVPLALMTPAVLFGRGLPGADKVGSLAWTLLVVPLSILGLTALMFYRGGPAPANADRELATQWNLGLCIFLVGVLALYSTYIFALIPNELGGGRFGCGALDLKKDEFSEATFSAFLSSTENDPKSTVVRTRMETRYLNLPGPYLLVRGISEHVKLKADAVTAITICRNR